MKFYAGSLSLVATAKLYAIKTNKVKSLEICNISETTLKNYTVEEFMSFRSDKSPIREKFRHNIKRKNFIFIYSYQRKIE